MRTLKHADRGKEVLDVQSRLKRLGYDVGTDGVDGFFGKDTARAVKMFQQRNGLIADGVVGDNTWCELVEAQYDPGERLLYLRIPPFRGADVLFLQRCLNRLGFNAGPEDGILGSATERAVLDFQKNAGLVVDGMVDDSVLKVMARVTKDGELHSSEAKIPDRHGGYAGGRSLSQMIVAIDPGHGGSDTGARSTGGVSEKELNLEVASRLARVLESAGAGVVLIRNTDDDLSQYDRAAMANASGSDIFLSIHHNACANPAAQGAAAAYFRRQGYFSEPGLMLAAHIVAAISRELGVPEIPVLGRNYAVLRETTMTAVQVEPFFITCSGAGSVPINGIADREAEAIFQGIAAYFET